jgi:hypothetical protein
MVTERTSRNTDAAFSKVTLRFRKLKRAFSGFQRRIGPMCLDYPLPCEAQRIADKLRAPKATGSFIGLLGRSS